ncbi:DUF927 domain-containing protein, partial [Pseudomonas aeruginosa]|nr:DUF927 domain-containing protein [Pseudomonas aeruginosa]
KPVPFDHRICAPLHVDALTLNSENGGVGRLLRFEFLGKSIEWIAPMDLLMGKGDDLVKTLSLMGLEVEYQHRRHIAAYLGGHERPERIIRTTTKPGWHESGVFVLPDRVIGAGDVRFQSSGRSVNLFTSKGTL